MLADRQLASSHALASELEKATRVQKEKLAVMKVKVKEGDRAAALEARDAIWAALGPMYASMFELADNWNGLTYRTAEADFLSASQSH